MFTPPAVLIEQAIGQQKNPPTNSTTSPALQFTTAAYKTLRGTIEMEWGIPAPSSGSNGTCALGDESTDLKFGCPGSTIASILFAEYGTPGGSCAAGFQPAKCAANQSMAFVSKCCVGKESCDVMCAGDTCTCDGSQNVSPLPFTPLLSQSAIFFWIHCVFFCPGDQYCIHETLIVLCLLLRRQTWVTRASKP